MRRVTDTASDGTPDADKAEDAYRRALELDPLYVPAQDALDNMSSTPTP